MKFHLCVFEIHFCGHSTVANPDQVLFLVLIQLLWSVPAQWTHSVFLKLIKALGNCTEIHA